MDIGLLTSNKVNDKIKFIKIWVDVTNMKNKVKMLCYECKKCNKRVFFRSDEEYSTKCKSCKNEMIFICESNYNPNSGLNAIKNSDLKNNVNTEFHLQKPTIECPYCHSSNTKKITNASKAVHTALFGVFSLSRNSKQWHCNHCGVDF